MHKAVIVYNSEPILGAFVQSPFRFDGSIKKYDAALLKDISHKQLNWKSEIDETVADIEEIISQGYDLIICLPGLQKKVVYDSNKINVIFLNSLEFKSNDTKRVTLFMEKIERETENS